MAAERPIFIPIEAGAVLVSEPSVTFEWIPGMAASQAKKRVVELHQAAKKIGGVSNLLEISSKSEIPGGVGLSAFNLSLSLGYSEQPMTVETAFQGSKVFRHGGPFTDLLYAKSIKAKKDARIRESGELIGFQLFDEEWPTFPLTAFYDWLYVSALRENPEKASLLMQYDAFTDIEFNPKKSFSCQARSAALYCSIVKRDKLSEVLECQESFLQFLDEFGYGVFQLT